MSGEPTGPIEVSIGQHMVTVDTAWPDLLSHYREHAELHRHFTVDPADRPSGFFFSAVRRAAEEWPSLVVTQEFSPAGHGFAPAVLLVPESELLLIGAGERLLAFASLAGSWRQAWEDRADMGFWSWRRHGDHVLMSAELELAAWSTTGLKLWTTSVEPPWSYAVVGDEVHLDVMGAMSRFSVRDGPEAQE